SKSHWAWRSSWMESATTLCAADQAPERVASRASISAAVSRFQPPVLASSPATSRRTIAQCRCNSSAPISPSAKRSLASTAWRAAPSGSRSQRRRQQAHANRRSLRSLAAAVRKSNIWLGASPASHSCCVTITSHYQLSAWMPCCAAYPWLGRAAWVMLAVGMYAPQVTPGDHEGADKDKEQ